MLGSIQGEKIVFRRRLVGLLREGISMKEGTVSARELLISEIAIEGTRATNLSLC